AFTVLRLTCVPHTDVQSEDEEGHRRVVWEENKKKIEKNNVEYEQGKTTYCMGLNYFSDMTENKLQWKAIPYKFV
ncbi:protein CTLA-2-alpha-like protein, partial [Cricetulus griseus]